MVKPAVSITQVQSHLRFVAESITPPQLEAYANRIRLMFHEVFDATLAPMVCMKPIEGSFKWPDTLDETGFVYEYDNIRPHAVYLAWEKYVKEKGIDFNALNRAMDQPDLPEYAKLLETAREVL